MPKITHIYSWNAASEGAAELAKALGAKRIKHNNSRFKGGPKKIIINWGSSNLPDEVLKSRVINSPQAVSVCSNKLSFFKAVDKKVSIPPWTTSLEEAMIWFKEGAVVCARQVLQGHSAEGLVLMHKDSPDHIIKAPLYTKYIPKADEFRIHVVNGAITDVQRKALRKDWHEENPNQRPNYKIRNHANGFIYARQGFIAPEIVLSCAVEAVKAVGLDFGAVDVIYNQKQDKGYVLEINTAPGVEGTSIVNYKAAFEDMK